MKLTKDKVLAVRENADRLLKKMESEEKDEVKKMAASYERFNGLIDRLVGKVESNESTQVITQDISDLKAELRQLMASFSSLHQQSDIQVLRSLDGIKQALYSQPRYSGENVVQAIRGLKLSVPEPKDRTDDIISAIKEIKLDQSSVKFPDELPVHVISMPPQKVPQPVTHISINSLRGTIHTTSATVGTTVTPLPDYGVLANRRSLIVYNNSSNTIYIGGSDVTVSNGMPVPANSYSPILDCGVNMIMYGIAVTGNNNVRVLEVSDEASGR